MSGEVMNDRIDEGPSNLKLSEEKRKLKTKMKMNILILKFILKKAKHLRSSS